jgi:FkbM family methyltransferase
MVGSTGANGCGETEAKVTSVRWTVARRLPFRTKLAYLAYRVNVATGRTRRVKRIGSFRMNLDLEYSVDLKINYGVYERDTVAAIRRHVGPGMVTVDVGAHIGYLTLVLAECVGPMGKVHAIEPSDRTFERLTANVALNGWSHVTTHRVAVGSREGDVVEMRLPHGYPMASRGRGTLAQQVAFRTLDTLLGGESRVDFIKTDTDGYEHEVLRGAVVTIEKHHPTILFELAPDHLRRTGCKPEALFEFLAEKGYRFTDMRDAPVDPATVARSIPFNKSCNLIASVG